MRCVLKTVRNDAHPRTFRTLADLDYRDTQRLDCRDAPPLECSVHCTRSHELPVSMHMHCTQLVMSLNTIYQLVYIPMFVRGHMRMGMCVYARLRRKYIFVLLNKVETD